ncbi:MFS transporter [Cellulomonas aerilata]|uniref:Putative sugar efflux transporter n=1 Tax=Cellulomonas aerilata TaxID=515326 RepID=A0A512DBG6_9CELL|nr:MFS transporter [Cellulomonas aerilata]GEO33822.1 putative sugar efflux transporter [Cellulomonas aerilata]
MTGDVPAPTGTTPSSGPSTPAAPARRSDAVASLAVAAVAFVVVTGETLPVGLISDVARGVDADESEVGLTVGWYALVAAVSAVPLTRLTARLDRRTVLVGCALVFAGGHVVAALATDLWVLLVGRSVAALTHGIYFAVATPAVVRLARPEARVRAGGQVAVGASVALVLGTPLATLLGQAAGWRIAMLVVAAVATVLALVVARLLGPLPALQRSGPRSADGVLATLRSRPLAVVMVITVVLVTGHFALFTYVAPYADERLGVHGATFSVVLLVYGGAAVVGSTLAGRVAEARPVGGVRVGAVVFTLASAGLWVAAQLGARPAGVVLLVVWGGTFSLLAVSTGLAVLRRVPGTRSETAFAVHGIVFQAGIVAGSALGSLGHRTGHLAQIPWVTATAGLLVLALLLGAGRAFRGGQPT